MPLSAASTTILRDAYPWNAGCSERVLWMSGSPGRATEQRPNAIAFAPADGRRSDNASRAGDRDILNLTRQTTDTNINLLY